MKSLFKRPFLPIFLTVLLCSLPAAAAPKNDRLDRARNYVLYYGGAEDDELRELAKYDVVIIDPQALGSDAKAKIARLKRNGCFVIGYLSYMEVADWHRYKDRVPQEWILKVDGKPWVPWGSNRAADLDNPEWRKLLVRLTKSEVIDYGCDGVFMDTLADIEHPKLPRAMREKQLAGLESLMKELRTAYPGFAFVGNWTIQATLPVMAKYADIICWENFQAKYFDKGDEANAFANRIRKELDAQRKKHRFKVYALWAAPAGGETYRERQRSAKLAESFGYLFYSCVGDYHTGFTAAGKH